MGSTHVMMAAGALATIAMTAMVLAIFRPARIRRRVLVAGFSMGLIPVVLWALRLAWYPVDATTVMFEAVLVGSFGLFMTVNGSCWASMDQQPSMVVAHTIHFQQQGPPSQVIIPSEYATDPTLQVPRFETSYHLPRLRTQVQAGWTPNIPKN